ncbi:EVE domain-containing protein, partial [Phyllosticta capitalensis]
HWLMKAEPESRLENGVDVKFSIDDLEAATEPEAWDGVRNHVAKKNMMSMKKGDLAFFYHSNCKTPGIAGIMEIVEEAAPDESAFDSKHPYYDAKSSREKPTWHCVKVAFRSKFEHPERLTLTALKPLAADGGPLANMQLFKQSRLSVSKVSLSEWSFI